MFLDPHPPSSVPSQPSSTLFNINIVNNVYDPHPPSPFPSLPNTVIVALGLGLGWTVIVHTCKFVNNT